MGSLTTVQLARTRTRISHVQTEQESLLVDLLGELLGGASATLGGSSSSGRNSNSGSSRGSSSRGGSSVRATLGIRGLGLRTLTKLISLQQSRRRQARITHGNKVVKSGNVVALESENGCGHCNSGLGPGVDLLNKALRQVKGGGKGGKQSSQLAPLLKRARCPP